MKMKGLILIVTSLIIGLGSISYSQGLEFPEDKVSWKFSVEQDGCDAYVVGEITIAKNWHVYAVHVPEGSFVIPTEMNLTSSSSFKTKGKVTEPKPHHEYDEATDEDLYYHSNKIVIKQKIEILSTGDFEIKGEFAFQTCDDSHCLPPFTTSFTVKVKGCSGEIEVEIPENELMDINGDEAKDKEGNTLINVNGSWHIVPEGNSVGFYKKYLQLLGNNE